MSQDDQEPIRIPDIEFRVPDLDLPEPPDEIAYTELEDWKARSILARNGIVDDAEHLAAALTSERPPILGFAAHASWRFPELAGALHGLLDDLDDAVQVEAAHALARQGDSEAGHRLEAALDRPVGPFLSPLTAAGYLAKSGNPAGYGVVRDALGHELRAVNMLAAKQLLFFLPLDGRVVGSDVVDAPALFRRAFDDPDPDIGAQARAELERSPLPTAASILASAG